MGARLVAIALIIGVCAIALALFALLVPGTPLDVFAKAEARESLQAMGSWFLVLLVAIGAVVSATAYGLLRRRRWGRWLAVALFGVNAAIDGVALIRREPVRAIAGALVAAAIIAYLCRPSVRAAFHEHS